MRPVVVIETLFCQTFADAASRQLVIGLCDSSRYFVIKGKVQECGADQGGTVKLMEWR